MLRAGREVVPCKQQICPTMAVASAATPAVRRRPYTMAELLAESDYRQPSMAEERVWVNSPAVGRKSL